MHIRWLCMLKGIHLISKTLCLILISQWICPLPAQHRLVAVWKTVTALLSSWVTVSSWVNKLWIYWCIFWTGMIGCNYIMWDVLPGKNTPISTLKISQTVRFDCAPHVSSVICVLIQISTYHLRVNKETRSLIFKSLTEEVCRWNCEQLISFLKTALKKKP